MQILRTSTNPLYLDITWTTLELFFWCLSFQSVWPIIQFSSKTIFSTHPDQTEIYTTSSPKTPFAFLPRSPIASHLPPTMGIVPSLLSSLAFIPRCAPFHLLPLSFPSSLLHNDQKEGPIFTCGWWTQKQYKEWPKLPPTPKRFQMLLLLISVLLTFHAAETFHPLLSFYDVI